METLNGLPVLSARNVDRYSCKTEPCPYCGREHIHGAGEIGHIGHKVAHCPPLEDVNSVNFRDVWKRLKTDPSRAPLLKKNPGYFVKIVG